MEYYDCKSISWLIVSPQRGMGSVQYVGETWARNWELREGSGWSHLSDESGRPRHTSHDQWHWRCQSFLPARRQKIYEYKAGLVP